MKKGIEYIRENIVQFHGDPEKHLVNCELISILSNLQMGEDWKDFMTKDFLRVVNDNLKSEDELIRINTIQLMAQLATDDKIAEIFLVKGLIKRMVMSFQVQYNREESFQKLFVIYNLIVIDKDITEIYDELLYIIDSFLEEEYRQRNVQVVSLLNEMMTLLYVKNQGDQELHRLFDKRFHIYNEEWERATKIEDWLVKMQEQNDFEMVQQGRVEDFMPDAYNEDEYYDDEDDYLEEGDQDDDYGYDEL